VIENNPVESISGQAVEMTSLKSCLNVRIIPYRHVLVRGSGN
jgi:hypothetical protein